MKPNRVFLQKDDGLVTIEWVMISAVVLLGALGISAMLLQGADVLGGSVANRMAEAAEDVGGGGDPEPVQ